MLSEKINKKIIDTATEMAIYVVRDSFYNLVNDMCFLQEEELDSKLPGDLLPHINKIRGLVHRLSEELNKEVARRDAYINDIYTLMHEYISAAMPYTLNAKATENLLHYANYVSELMKAEEDKSPTDEEMYHSIAHEMYHRICDLIDEAEEADGLKGLGASLASLIPLRMTREKYGDIIRRGINLLKESAKEPEELRSLISFIEYNCLPQLCQGFDSPIEELYRENISDYNREKLDEYIERVGLALEEASLTFDSVNMAYNDLNYLYIVAAFSTGEDMLTNNDPLVRDLLYSCREMLEEGNGELMYEALLEKSTEMIEDAYEAIKDTQREYRELLGKYSREDMSEEANNLVNMQEYIEKTFYREIDADTAPACTALHELADEDPVTELINLTMEATKRYPVAIGKYIRRSLFAYVPLDMTAEELKEYYNYCLDAHKATGENKLALGLLYEELMEAEEHHHHHHHHHHHGDCDCHHHH